jgi:hypothetical protein
MTTNRADKSATLPAYTSTRPDACGHMIIDRRSRQAPIGNCNWEILSSKSSAIMITLTLILLLVFVPASRRVLSGMILGAFSLLGLAFLISRESGGRRRGF